VLQAICVVPRCEFGAGRIVVAISWLQSLNRLVSPIPSVVRFNQEVDSEEGSESMSFCP
jgi:hypothetical protein